MDASHCMVEHPGSGAGFRMALACGAMDAITSRMARVVQRLPSANHCSRGGAGSCPRPLDPGVVQENFVKLLLDKGRQNAHFARGAGEHRLALVAPRRVLALVRQPALLGVFGRSASAGLRRRPPLFSRRWRSGAWHVFAPRGHISVEAVAAHAEVGDRLPGRVELQAVEAILFRAGQGGAVGRVI